MKSYIGNCVNLPYEELGLNDGDINGFIDYLEQSKEISLKDFVDSVDIEAETMKNFILYPNDFEFKKNGEVYYYINSCIEYFYK